ncbi:hypothetical protein ACQJBY_033674 [Aegilops geniculata]
MTNRVDRSIHQLITHLPSSLDPPLPSSSPPSTEACSPSVELARRRWPRASDLLLPSSAPATPPPPKDRRRAARGAASTTSGAARTTRRRHASARAASAASSGRATAPPARSSPSSTSIGRTGPRSPLTPPSFCGRPDSSRPATGALTSSASRAWCATLITAPTASSWSTSPRRPSMSSCGIGAAAAARRSRSPRCAPSCGSSSPVPRRCTTATSSTATSSRPTSSSAKKGSSSKSATLGWRSPCPSCRRTPRPARRSTWRPRCCWGRKTTTRSSTRGLSGASWPRCSPARRCSSAMMTMTMTMTTTQTMRSSNSGASSACSGRRTTGRGRSSHRCRTPPRPYNSYRRGTSRASCGICSLKRSCQRKDSRCCKSSSPATPTSD